MKNAHQKNRNTAEEALTDCVPEILTDEAAVVVYQFLEELMLQFENQYYAQIRRHYRVQEQHAMHDDRQMEMLWEDDTFEF